MTLKTTTLPYSVFFLNVHIIEQYPQFLGEISHSLDMWNKSCKLTANLSMVCYFQFMYVMKANLLNKLFMGKKIQVFELYGVLSNTLL